MKHRLSYLETIDDIALAAVQLAYDRVRSGRMTQVAMHEALCADLEALGVARVSLSGFNRWALAIREGRIGRPKAMPQPSGIPQLSDASASPGIRHDISEETAGLIFAAARAIFEDLNPAAREEPETSSKP